MTDDHVAIEFSDTGEAARINYSVPLPGAHTGRRLVELDLKLEDKDFKDSAKTAGTPLADAIGLQTSNKAAKSIDPAKAAAFFLSRVKKPQNRVSRLISTQPALAAGLRASIEARPGNDPEDFFGINLRDVPDLPRPVSVVEDDQRVFRHLDLSRHEYLSSLFNDVVQVPSHTWSGAPTTTPAKVSPKPKPRLLLVEVYGISSFLGDYGMGRTVKTFTLLPGETTRISLKTWQSSRESIEQSSSIIDSHEQSARDRFAETIQDETTDKATQSKTEEWHVEAEASGSWGVASASLSAGASGEYQSGREQFARQASEAVSEHASEASSKRELSVSSSSERTEESGSETLIERTITNVNMRRVLNFVFRELNQTYTTKLHLKEVRVAFTNGNLDTWREVPISGLRGLLDEVVVADRIEEVSAAILAIAGQVFDHEDTAVSTLEKVVISEEDGSLEVSDAHFAGKTENPVPGGNTYYRFKRGPLGQDNAPNKVPGVLVSEQQITMRTDSVIVEALLGQADALDNYAMQIQEAAADAKTLANDRERLIQATLNAIPDPAKRADMVARIYGPSDRSGG